MKDFKVRTRFAPSPTGFMHVGNLRSALYAYLIAKSQNGGFVLRIEDTDQSRLMPEAEKVIRDTLFSVGIKYDEGPDVPGNFGPYVQSQRKRIYREKAFELVKKGGAYFCFCKKKDNLFGYDRKCRNLSCDEIKKALEIGEKFVIRQKMPLEGKTKFNDMVFGDITIENNELEDNVLLKSDGFPTYNFANVVDDHLMKITHVVRGCEYLTSTPKYNILYKTFGWEIPKYVHLPLIMSKNSDGSVTKLSKRTGSFGFGDLIRDGFLAEAIINYIALLGWCPRATREIFSLDELLKEFSIDRIGKSSAIFDYRKLSWMNGEYIRNKTLVEFTELVKKYLKNDNFSAVKIAKVLQPRLERLTEIPNLVDFIYEVPNFSKELFVNKKSKTNLENTPVILKKSLEIIKNIEEWNNENIYSAILATASFLGLKNSAVVWCVRIAASGKAVTPGGSSEILEILGKNETIKRIKNAIDMFNK